MEIEAVLFDLDGVIVTTDGCHYEAWKRMADEEGIYFDRTINERLRGVSREKSLEIILERAEKTYTAAQKAVMAERKNAYYKERIAKLTPDDVLAGAKENLERLRAAGVKTAIGSSSKNAPVILERIGLVGAFDAVSDGNGLSRSKPDPEVFLRAAEKLSVSPARCLVVEDADAGIAAGKAGGMKTLAVGSATGGDFYAPSLAAVDVLKLIRG